MINTEHWKQIISDYKTARNCLVCPKHCGTWYREETKGLFYLLKANLAAAEEPEKDHLWYARILMQMAYPGHFNLSDYDRFHKYMEPAMNEYRQVEKPERVEKEVSQAQREFDVLKTRLDFCSGESEACYRRYLSLIENSELLYEKDIWFQDGKVVSFRCDEVSGTLQYRYGRYLVTLEFEDIDDLQVHNDHDAYIDDFVCYPAFPWNTNTKVFDIGSHKITCEKIRVAAIAEQER